MTKQFATSYTCEGGTWREDVQVAGDFFATGDVVVNGTLMVDGDVVVYGNLDVEKLVSTGRVKVSGEFAAHRSSFAKSIRAGFSRTLLPDDPDDPFYKVGGTA